MGCSMVDVKQGGWIQKWVNDTLHLMLGEETPLVKGQDQIIQLINYCFTSISVTSIDEENKNNYRKINKALTQIIRPNCIALHAGKQGGVLLGLKFWPQYLKNSCRTPNQNFLDANVLLHIDAPVLDIQEDLHINILCGDWIQSGGPTKSVGSWGRESLGSLCCEHDLTATINHFLHIVKWFYVLLYNISNSIYQVFLCNINNLHTALWFQVSNDNPY